MPLKIGTVEPTQIIVDYPSQSFDVTTSTENVTVYRLSETTVDGSVAYFYKGSSQVTYTYTHTNLKLNGILLTSVFQTILTKGLFTYKAKYSSKTLTIDTIYYATTTASAVSSKTVKFLSSTFAAIPCVEITRVQFIGLGHSGSTGCWGKPYTVTRNAGANTSINLSRSYSSYENASTGTVVSGEKIYDGDLVWFYATPATCYKITSFIINGSQYASGQTGQVSKQLTITSDCTVSTSATQYKCLSPSVSGTITYKSSDSTNDSWLARINIYNPNSFACTALYTAYKNGGTLADTSGSGGISIPAKSSKGVSITYTLANGGVAQSTNGGFKITVQLSATNYTISDGSSGVWNNYSEGTEETTTTTTT